MPTPQVSDVQFRPTAGGAVVEGIAGPGVAVEAVNLSTIPSQRYRPDDAFVLTTASGDGQFDGVMNVRPGDFVRLRGRDAGGAASNWVTVRAAQLGSDRHNAEVALFRMALQDLGGGKVELANINPARPISEPLAQIAFVNERSGAREVFTLDDLGQFPGKPTLPGRAGDSFSVRVSDGTNDPQLRAEVGKVSVPAGGASGGRFDLPDPALHNDELRADGTPRFSTQRFAGPLFGPSGPKPSDVEQGAIGDCYLPSAVAALAHVQPGFIRRIVKDEGGGKYSVVFKKRDHRGGAGAYKSVKVVVDGDLWARSSGGPLYGSGEGPDSIKKMVMWWPILEKAYAQWKGTYNTIGDGGSSAKVFEEILGRRAVSTWINGTSPDAIYEQIEKKLASNLPVSAGTYGKSNSGRYTGTGVFANHSYSLLGCKQTDGKRYVELRNPWGESEPRPGDGDNDGVFCLQLDEFCHLYRNLYSVV